MEKSSPGKYLEYIKIEGLWNHFEVDWQLHPDVNILVGENGTGKSTILRLLAASLFDDFSVRERKLFETIEVRVGGQIYHFKEALAAIHYRGERAGFAEYHLGGPKQDILHVDYINTFDNFTATKDENGETAFAKTVLDHQLDAVTRQYLAYHYQQSNKVFAKQLTFEEAFAQKAYLLDTLNRLFVSTGKKVDEQNGELEFLIDSATRITRHHLSSGEKQLLIILLTVLCQEEKQAVLLLDEPEISMHLRWQYELIDIIRHLNPHCQVVIATHSPSIFNDGWRDKVFWVGDIVKRPVTA